MNNYPPVYLELMSAFGGDVFARLERGRRLSFLAALFAALMVATIAFLGSPGSPPVRFFAGLVGAALFLALEPVRLWGSLARVDMFGLAAVLAGVMALKIPGWKGRAMALLLFMIALWTKQSLIAAPLALVVVIGLRRPREALLLAALALLAGLGGVAAMQGATEGRFFFHVVTANRTDFSFALLGHQLLRFLHEAWPLLPWAAIGLAFVRAVDGRRRFLRVWLLFAAFGLVSLGKTGSSSNYMLESLAILAALAGAGLGALGAFALARPRSVAGLAFVLGLLVFLWPPDLERGRFGAELPRRDRELEAGMDLVRAEVARSDGDVLSWDMSLPVLAGKRLGHHPFMMADLVRRGLFGDDLLLRRIEDGEFPLVVTSFDLADRERFQQETRGLAPLFTERVLAAVARHYVLERVVPLPAHLGGAWVFYRPR